MQAKLRSQAGWVLFLATALGACREGRQNTNFTPLAPLGGSANALCSMAPVAYSSLTLVYTDPGSIINDMSQISGSAFDEKLYLSGVGGVVVELDYSGMDPDVASETEVLAAGLLDSSYLVPSGISTPGAISGMVLVEAGLLIGVEHTSNSLVMISVGGMAQSVSGLVGQPNEIGGFADGFATGARFHFPAAVPMGILATDSGRIFVTDGENHALREVAVDPMTMLGAAFTFAGSGVSGHVDGSLSSSRFDTPNSLAVLCDGRLLVGELGAGQDLRAIISGAGGFGGGTSGQVTTLVGDGTPATSEGLGTLAQVFCPESLVMGLGGMLYWMDAGSGILRRYDEATGSADCPLFVDCASALMAGGSFSGSGHYSLAVSAAGNLYVMDALAGEIYRVD